MATKFVVLVETSEEPKLYRFTMFREQMNRTK